MKKTPQHSRRIILLIILVISILPIHAQINIPDPNFKAALLADPDINLNMDGEIQQSEAIAFNDTIQVSSLSISDLTGIEEFVNIIHLSAINNSISGVLDLSSNVGLKRIYLNNNPITTLVLPTSSQLLVLSAENNDFTTIDVSANPNLTTLLCANNPNLLSINCSNNPDIGNLDCSNSSLTALDLSSCTDLQILHAENNSITSLVLPTSNNLYQLYANNNLIASLNLIANSNLNFAYVQNNSLTDISLPNSTFLNYLFCQNNNLTCLDVSSLSTLVQLNCSNNSLQSLNLKNGNNTSMANASLNALNNPSLACIQVDDSTYSANTWTNIPSSAFFMNNCGAPVANFTTDADSCFGVPVQFTDLSTNADEWIWNMSNIDTLYVTNPIYTFAWTGYFNIELEVSNCYGSDSHQQTIAVGREISGTITSSISIGAGNVLLFKHEPVFIAFDTISMGPIQPGSYTLGLVAPGNYVIKAIPDLGLYPTLLPTYFGNEWAWDSATVVNHTCNAATVADISILDQNTLPLGSGTLAGSIIEGMGFGRAQGDPVHGVDVKLGITATSQIVGCTETDLNGEYGFNDLPNGSYTIYVDIPGLERDSSYQITIDSTNSQFLNLDYVVDSSKVYIVPSIGIEENPDEDLKLTIFPNPATVGFNIQGYVLSDNAVLNIYDISGKLILSQAVNETNHYTNANFNSGTYFLELFTSSGTWRGKLIKQ